LPTRCRTDKLDGVIKRRSSRETTMVGRGASLDGRLFLGGTDGSNLVPSSSESETHRDGLHPLSAASTATAMRFIERPALVASQAITAL